MLHAVVRVQDENIVYKIIVVQVQALAALIYALELELRAHLQYLQSIYCCHLVGLRHSPEWVAISAMHDARPRRLALLGAQAPSSAAPS